MALINCPECGKEVSDKAVSCPGCGFGIAGSSLNDHAISKVNEHRIDTVQPMSAQINKKSPKMLIIAIAAFAVLACFLLYGSKNMQPLSTTEELAIVSVERLSKGLKSPSTLEIHNFSAARWDINDKYDFGPYAFMFKIEYSAQNSFGALLKDTDYIGTFGNQGFILTDKDLEKAKSKWDKLDAGKIESINIKKIMKKIK